jgi:hypothetical protein
MKAEYTICSVIQNVFLLRNVLFWHLQSFTVHVATLTKTQTPYSELMFSAG